jgi:hypothetical protein
MTINTIIPADAGDVEFCPGNADHVWQLCCEEAERAQRQRELSLLKSEQAALNALLAMCARPPAPTPVKVTFINRVLAMLESGDMTAAQLAERLREDKRRVAVCCYELRVAGRITQSGRHGKTLFSVRKAAA